MPMSPFLVHLSISAHSIDPVRGLVRAPSAKHRRYFLSAMPGHDHEDDVTYLEAGKTRIVDIGDADIIHTDTEQNTPISKQVCGLS